MYFRIILLVCGTKINIIGAHHLDKSKKYIFMSNHTSVYDIPVLFDALPFWMIAICKESISKWPIFGFLCKLGGCIFVNRENTDSAINALNEGVYELRDIPKSVLAFPEGRIPSDISKIQQFKTGVFIFAIQTGMPIVPIAVKGCRDVFGKDFSFSHKIRAGEITVVIGEPICTRNMFAYGYDKIRLSNRVYKEISEMYVADCQ